MRIAIIGLGYVGLPLAISLSKKYNVVGFDINKNRIQDLINGFDTTKQINKDNLISSNIEFTFDHRNLFNISVFIIAVPTPIKITKEPDLENIINATEMVSKYLKRESYVIYESTVYPGLTEEICLPILKKNSGLKLNEDFYIGYSPERINPGDNTKTIDNIVKITSGSCKKASDFIDDLYKSIINAGTFKAESIKVAEAAKVIENIQRDVNIALINELSMIFNKMGIDTIEVLNASASKWNFHKYLPGLVGGHCIGVDPYYLKHKADQLGINSRMISAGRYTNDYMPEYIATKFMQILLKKVKNLSSVKVLIMGITFKEDCQDIRNSKVFDLILELKKFSIKVDVFDPIANPLEVLKEHNIYLNKKLNDSFYDGLILAVPHDYFLKKGIKYIKNILKKESIFFDLKSVYSKNDSDFRL